MKRNLFAIFLALALVVAMVFVIAPSAKAEETIYKAESDGTIAFADVEGKILDLNGCSVAVEVPEGGTLKVIDTANTNADGVTGAGKLTKTGDGTVAVVAQYPEVLNEEAEDYRFSLMRYLKVANEDDTFSFHPFNLTISQLGLNTKKGAICLRATFLANDKAIGSINDHGISIDGEPHTAAVQYPFKSNFVIVYADLNGSLSDDIALDIQKTAKAYITVNGEAEPIYSTYEANITPRQVLKGLNNQETVEKATETQKSAIVNELAAQSHLKNLFTSFTGAECEHQGGTATCTVQATCIDCDASYGDMLDHSYTTYVSTKKAAVGGTLGYDTYKCTCGVTEKFNWTRHILDKALTDKEKNAIVALTPEDWNGNGNLNGAGQWFYKAAGVDVSSVLTKTAYNTMTALFTTGSSETKLWPIPGNTTDFAKMMITNYYGGSAAYKHARFVPEDFQIGDIFTAKGICKTCGNAHYMVALYQGNGRFLSVSNCGGGSKCEVTCAYDETTVFAEDFFAQTDVATWNYYFVLRPNMLTQIRDMSASTLTDAEKEIISNLTAADVSSGYGNLNGFANEVYKLAGVDAAAYLNLSSWNAHTKAFAAESSNWTKMLLPNSWGGTNHGEDKYDLSTYAFAVGDIISGKMTPTGGKATYVTAIYQGEDNFLVQNTTAGTVSVMTLAEIFAEGNTWDYYFAMRPDQLASAE